MGFMTSIREGSISLRRYTSRSSTATSPSRSRSQSSSADSSANVSRTTTPAPLTRQEKLSALLAQSLQTPSLPPPSAASGSSPSAGVEAQVAPVQTAAVDSDANAPKKYRDFLEQAKKGNPSYRAEKLRPMAAFDEQAGYNFFMQRRRVNGHSA